MKVHTFYVHTSPIHIQIHVCVDVWMCVNNKIGDLNLNIYVEYLSFMYDVYIFYILVEK